MNLYAQLLNLCNNPIYDNAFYFDDQQLDSLTYRIFNYRLVGWTTFQESPESLECRGIMFDITDEDDIKLVCRPPKKFFNYAEGSVDHTANFLLHIHEKLDGSLISSYMHLGDLRLKSKGSIKSKQAEDAMRWLNKPENTDFKLFIKSVTEMDNTINFEWTSPSNRIVVGYKEDNLRILSIRNNLDHRVGTKFPSMDASFPSARMIKVDKSKITEEIVDAMYKETVGEGYVLTFIDKDSGQTYQVKVKNHKYCNLHKIKDSISNPEALAELIISGESDDVIEAFSEDQNTLDVIYEMENKIIPIYNNMIKTVEKFYSSNKHLIRKDFAILTKAEQLNYMPLLMDLYIGREIDYKQFAIKRMTKLFGVKNQTYKSKTAA